MLAPLEFLRVVDGDPLDALEVYPCTIEWGELAAQLLELGLTRRDIAIALALASDDADA